MSNTANSTILDSSSHQVVAVPLTEGDLPDAEQVFRTAFGSFLGAPEPDTFYSDRDYVYGRWHALHVAALGATRDGRLVGSNFATNWGSVGFFGPLTVHVDCQDRGVAKALLAATMGQFGAWGTRHVGLFTFPHSPKHLALYQNFGFHARFLTAIMSIPVRPAPAPGGWQRFNALDEPEQAAALHACREVAETLCPGLDLSCEIGAVRDQGLGDTVLLWGSDGLAAFAVCHHGPASEAGAGTCLVKFAAVRDAPSAGQDFRRLLDACDAFTREAGMPTLLVGVNLAYQELGARGFRTAIQGVAMHRHNDPGYCRPGIYILNDWR